MSLTTLNDITQDYTAHLVEHGHERHEGERVGSFSSHLLHLRLHLVEEEFKSIEDLGNLRGEEWECTYGVHMNAGT